RLVVGRPSALLAPAWASDPRYHDAKVELGRHIKRTQKSCLLVRQAVEQFSSWGRKVAGIQGSANWCGPDAWRPGPKTASHLEPSGSPPRASGVRMPEPAQTGDSEEPRPHSGAQRNRRDSHLPRDRWLCHKVAGHAAPVPFMTAAMVPARIRKSSHSDHSSM